MEKTIDSFMNELSSGNPTPGGGGASALIGAIGVALCSMVANLTSGKKKYANYQHDIDGILARTQLSIRNLLELMQKDEEVFAPLAAAYGIPKANPDRDSILEAALLAACSVPVKLVDEMMEILDILAQLYEKGSKLVVSDVGVAAAACRCALEGALMNITINTKLMKDRACAEEINANASRKVATGVERCRKIYDDILDELR